MTNIKTKIAVGLSTAAFLATSIAPAAFADSIVIRRNGAGSTNKVKVESVKKTKVSQSNSTAVLNLTGVTQNTGGNKANNNTGDGDVDIDSGNAGSTVTNTTTTGGNSATVSGCGCPEDGSDITVARNGAGSYNKVVVKSTNKTKVSQTNETFVLNATEVDQNTGGNKANNNTGDGDVDIDSGNATSTVTNSTTTGNNSVVIN